MLEKRKSTFDRAKLWVLFQWSQNSPSPQKKNYLSQFSIFMPLELPKNQRRFMQCFLVISEKHHFVSTLGHFWPKNLKAKKDLLFQF